MLFTKVMIVHENWWPQIEITTVGLRGIDWKVLTKSRESTVGNIKLFYIGK